MVKKRTQELRVKDVPREYIDMFNSLARTFESNQYRGSDAEVLTKSEMVAEMVELYFRHKLAGDDGKVSSTVECIIASHKRDYEHG